MMPSGRPTASPLAASRTPGIAPPDRRTRGSAREMALPGPGSAHPHPSRMIRATGRTAVARPGSLSRRSRCRDVRRCRQRTPTSRLAPPTSPPSMSGCAINSRRCRASCCRRTGCGRRPPPRHPRAGQPAAHERARLLGHLRRGGLPVPMAQTGSYATTTAAAAAANGASPPPTAARTLFGQPPLLSRPRTRRRTRWAEDRHPAPPGLAGHRLVGLAEELPALRVADDCPAHAKRPPACREPPRP